VALYILILFATPLPIYHPPPAPKKGYHYKCNDSPFKIK
jgi:hypothetical protein